MGFELWYSDKTKVSRKGTTYSELQNIFIDNITTKFIYEPLACCKIYDDIQEVRNELYERDFDTLGVVDEEGKKIGYIIQQELKEEALEKYLNPFDTNILISDSTPISDLIEILAEKEYVYVLDRNSIEGIVTRADINKPIVRIYLFGIISLFELHLNYWIEKNHPKNSWIELLSEARIVNTKAIYELRKGDNSQLTFLECIQICDKKTILSKTGLFKVEFDFSTNELNRLLKDLESIRNELVHSQNSIIANLEWIIFVSTIKAAKLFLIQSESKIMV